MVPLVTTEAAEVIAVSFHLESDVTCTPIIESCPRSLDSVTNMPNSDRTMTLPEEPQERLVDIPNEEPGLLTLVIADVTAKVLRGWRKFLLAIFAGAAISTIIAFLTRPSYTSMAQLMPPNPAVFDSGAGLASLFSEGLAEASFSGDFLSEKTPGAVAIGIMNSPMCLDDVINRLNLRSVFRVNLYTPARRNLLAETKFSEDKNTGIVSITVEDEDKYRARDIAQAYVDELNGLLNNLSTSTARRERIFLEGRLKDIKTNLDNTTRELGEFSSQNAALDPTKQGADTMEAAGRIEEQLIIAESNLSALKTAYASDNVRVREAQSRIDSLQRELKTMTGGRGEINGGSDERNGGLPSVRELPLLGVRYYDLYREMSIQEAAYASLSKEYETAKVEEAEEIPSVKMLTPPSVAEIKSSPQRKKIVLLGTILVASLYILWFALGSFWKYADELSTIKIFANTVRDSVWQSWPHRAVIKDESPPNRNSE